MAGHGNESGGAIAAAFAANMGIAATKFVGFIITGSSSLLAEAIHSVADGARDRCALGERGLPVAILSLVRAGRERAGQRAAVLGLDDEQAREPVDLARSPQLVEADRAAEREAARAGGQ